MKSFTLSIVISFALAAPVFAQIPDSGIKDVKTIKSSSATSHSTKGTIKPKKAFKSKYKPSKKHKKLKSTPKKSKKANKTTSVKQ